MRGELLAWADRRGGVVTRRDAVARFAAYVVDDALRAGAIVRMLPSTYVLPHLAGSRDTSRQAALLHLPHAALAGRDALDVWAVLDRPVASGRVRLVTDETRPANKLAALRLTRRMGFRNGPPDVVVRGGLRVTRLEDTVIDVWSELAPVDRRAPALVAVRDRRTTGARLLAALAVRGRVAGAADMRRLFGLIAAGCHSELELWGNARVFDCDGLRHARCQVRIRTSRGVAYLDRYYDEEKLAVEMDGAAYHGTPRQRECDIRRDAALAALGIQTLRFSHLRLVHDVASVRAETLAVLAARRAQLAHRAS